MTKIYFIVHNFWRRNVYDKNKDEASKTRVKKYMLRFLYVS